MYYTNCKSYEDLKSNKILRKLQVYPVTVVYRVVRSSYEYRLVESANNKKDDIESTKEWFRQKLESR